MNIFTRRRALGCATILIALCGLYLWFAIPGSTDSSKNLPFEKIETSSIKPKDLPNGKLAMSAFMLTGNDKGENEWRESLKRMHEMGVRVLEIGQTPWSETERERGKYQWGYAETVFRIIDEEKLDFEVVADIGMFMNPGLDGAPKLPLYLDGKKFDDPKVIEGLSKLYEVFLGRFGARVKYLFQHGENFGVYLTKHPEDLPRAQKLLRESFARAKRLRPGLKTGVCVQSYAKPHWNGDWMLALNESTDIIPIISFGPAHFDAKDADAARRELATVLDGFKGRISFASNYEVLIPRNSIF